MVGFAGELAIQPDLGAAPVASHGHWRDLEHHGGLFDAETAEKSHFDDMHFARIDARKRVQRVIERHEVDARIDADEHGLIQRDMRHAASAFEVTTSCMLYQDTAHQLRGYGEEVHPILPLHPLVIHEADVGLVDQDNSTGAEYSAGSTRRVKSAWDNRHPSGLELRPNQIFIQPQGG